MNIGQFRACKWLLELLKKEKNQTMNEICKAWGKEKALSGGLEMLPRSFHRYKKTLREEFGVEICCRDKDYAYYIKNPEILDDQNIPQWMLNTLSVDEKLKECISLMNRIRLERIPSGGHKLDTVTYAMLRDRKLIFKYHGIYNSGRDITNIVLRAFDDEGFYMRDLPIHPSQKEIGAGNGYVDFMISVRPNNELMSYVLSRKDRLKVLSPEPIVDEMKAAVLSIYNLYQK